MFRPRNPPKFTQTLYDSHILWDSHLRWDGITIIPPNWGERTPIDSTWTNRTGPLATYTWGTADITWGNANITWAGNTKPNWTPRN